MGFEVRDHPKETRGFLSPKDRCRQRRATEVGSTKEGPGRRSLCSSIVGGASRCSALCVNQKLSMDGIVGMPVRGGK